MKFEVTVMEELSRRVKVAANNAEEAADMVRDMYYKQDIVLDSEDYVDTTFSIDGVEF